MLSYSVTFPCVFADVSGPTVHLLLEELKEVDDWYSLGFELTVPVSKLKEIEASCSGVYTRRRKIEVLQYWIDSTPTASWEDVISALEKLDHHTLAGQLRSKYVTGLCAN